METIDAYKKRIERQWISDFREVVELENTMCEGSDLHRNLGKIETPEDFWHFYLLAKQDRSSASTMKLTVFQRTKATQFFALYLGDPAIHWFFIQAINALEHELYIPACSAILNGIEASLRRTLHQMEKPDDITILSPYKVLSNALVSRAQDLSLPTQALSFPNEIDFNDKLASRKPNRVDIEIVRVRNNICHGNILEYIAVIPETNGTLLTPECLRDLAWDLIDVSWSWVYSLGLFRMDKGLHSYFPR